MENTERTLPPKRVQVPNIPNLHSYLTAGATYRCKPLSWQPPRTWGAHGWICALIEFDDAMGLTMGEFGDGHLRGNDWIVLERYTLTKWRAIQLGLI
jgi:hypothetical protein